MLVADGEPGLPGLPNNDGDIIDDGSGDPRSLGLAVVVGDDLGTLFIIPGDGDPIPERIDGDVPVDNMTDGDGEDIP